MPAFMLSRSGLIIGLTAGWFFRRHLSAKVSISRTRQSGALVPEFRDSDTASIRLLGRF